MNIKKYMILGGVGLAMGLSSVSCVGDLDLEPIDPTKIFADPADPEFVGNAFAECYAIMGFAGTAGPGDANLSVPDAGASVYNRVIFEMQEFPTDEVFWIWEDNGLRDMNINNYSASNKQIEICYSRLYQHIAICNSFLSVTEDNAADPEIAVMRDEVRTLRAMSYYWVVDIFGNGGFTIGAPDGTEPVQTPRAEIAAWLETELIDLVENSNLKDVPAYGRVGKDAAEALLARLYLNYEVYAGTGKWAECLRRCNNIINRHKGGGFRNSGLAEHFLYLFCRNNSEYMPGGGNAQENEILWGQPYDADKMQSYGGTTWLIAAPLSEGDLGSQASWSCMTARKQLSERFLEEPNDVRWSLWKTDAQGRGIENEAFLDFSIAGYQALKWNGLTKAIGGAWSETVTSTTFASTDLAWIRLSDIYLMRAECWLNGVGDPTEALEGVNLVRARAGVSEWQLGQLTADNLLEERSRELYYEMTRRTDLIRFGKYVGPAQAVWSWKGNAPGGSRINDRYALMPIPTNILAAQPDFKQNPGF